MVVFFISLYSLFLSGLYHFSVLEDIAVGEAIGRIKANDLDIGENAKSSYDIIEGDGMDIFEITPDSQNQEGIIRLRKVNDMGTGRNMVLWILAIPKAVLKAEVPNFGWGPEKIWTSSRNIFDFIATIVDIKKTKQQDMTCLIDFLEDHQEIQEL